MTGTEWRAKATIWRYVMAVLSGMRGACIVCVCVIPPCWWVSCAGVASAFARVRLIFPYMCVDKALAVVYDACESILRKPRECLHQGLEEGGVVGPRGGVCLGVLDFSSGLASLNLEPRGGQGFVIGGVVSPRGWCPRGRWGRPRIPPSPIPS